MVAWPAATSGGARGLFVGLVSGVKALSAGVPCMECGGGLGDADPMG
jgi:hypothetical protein